MFPKGRRLGATRGAAVAFTKWMGAGYPCLWGDTINSNIDRYVERYFEPFLKHHNIKYDWNSRKKLLRVGNGYTDFRSADRPENWEGFGYKKIFLNEAGIILNDEYLYQNAVLPMMMDFPDSQLIAAGTPKLLSGVGKNFYELCQKAVNKEPGYYTRTFTTYDNPFLEREQIHALEMEIPARERQQEIYGVFVLKGGAVVQIGWFRRYSKLPDGKPDQIVHSWDTASKGKELSDPSVKTTWHVYGENYYLVHVHKEIMSYPALRRTAMNYIINDKPDVVLIEDKSSGQSLIEDLEEDRPDADIVAIEPERDKISRMSTASLEIERGHVWLPEQAPWLLDYEAEIKQFPDSTFDDQVDSTSQFLNWKRKPKPFLLGR